MTPRRSSLGFRSDALAALAAAAVVAVLPACGSAGRGPGTADAGRSAQVPDVTGEPLDAAADRLEAAGLRHESIGGGFPAPGEEAAWVVCDQRPRAGRVLEEASKNVVHLKVARRGGCASPTH